MAALGCADRLVAVDDFSDWPPEVVALPRVGKDLDVDVEKVAASKPDLVLASLTVPGHERVVDAVDRAGLRYLAPDPASLADVYRDVRVIAGALGVPERGEALVAAMVAAMPEAAPGRRPPVLVEWWPKPVYAPGRHSWVTDLLALAGARNPVGDRDAKSLPVGPEDVGDVEAIVMSWCGVPEARYRPEVVLRRPGWEGVPAVRDRRVVPIAEAFLGRPGPRLVEGYRALRALVTALEGAVPEAP